MRRRPPRSTLTDTLFPYTSPADRNRLPAAPGAQTAQAPEGRAAETAATADQTGDTAAAVSSDGQTLRVETDVYIAEISTLGGEIRRIELKQYPANKDKPEPMSLLDDRNGRLFILQIGRAHV